jgi:hypothetical protein
VYASSAQVISAAKSCCRRSFGLLLPKKTRYCARARFQPVVEINAVSFMKPQTWRCYDSKPLVGFIRLHVATSEASLVLSIRVERPRMSLGRPTCSRTPRHSGYKPSNHDLRHECSHTQSMLHGRRTLGDISLPATHAWSWRCILLTPIEWCLGAVQPQAGVQKGVGPFILCEEVIELEVVAG